MNVLLWILAGILVAAALLVGLFFLVAWSMWRAHH